MNLPILFEDESLLVIDKPAGVVVNRAQSVKDQTVQDWMEEKILRTQESKIHITNDTDSQLFNERSGIVHRLDKETSGILLLAKTPDVLVHLLAQFKNRTVHKEYTALVHGKVVPKEGSIDAPVGRLPWNRVRFGVFAGGRSALTAYSVKQYLRHPSQSDPLTLLTLTPHTGRTHQIRVHLQYIHHPVVSDLLYAGRKQSRADHAWCPRLFLHASAILFSHPITGKEMKIQSMLPGELQKVVRECEKITD